MKINHYYSDLHWQMTNCEKFALEGLLRNLSPEVSIEIGTYEGGSLQVLSQFSSEVVSIDIDENVKGRLAGKFSNVFFHSGDSVKLLPGILEQYSTNGRSIGFVLIDGDHSTEGVRRDINVFLQWRPKNPCLVLMHDSFNPSCRAGIKTASWHTSPYVQSIELDYIPGIYHQKACDTAAPRTMWGGFAMAILSPERRVGPLEIKASQQGLFDAVHQVSCHVLSRHRVFSAAMVYVSRKIRNLMK